MQDLDNNINDLLRKAAEHYQPALGKSDWDKIVSNLKIKETSPAGISVISRKIAYSALLVILFLFAGVLFDNVFSPHSSFRALINDSPVFQSSGIVEKSQISDKTNSKTNARVSSEEQWKLNQALYSNQERPKNMKRLQFIEYSNELPQMETALIAKQFTHNNADFSKSVNDEMVSSQFEKEYPILADLSDKATVDSTFNKEIIFNNQQPLTVNSQKDNLNAQSKKNSQAQKGFYIGALAGLEFNGVKQLNIDKLGYKLGLLVGYKINSRISLETGLQFNNKNYNADGQYFNMEKMNNSMPNGMKVLSLTGNCNEFELPVSVNYKIATIESKNIYLSAGVSSYLLSKESNLYNTVLNGNQAKVSGLYKKDTGYFAATVNFSIGFENKLKSGNSFRLAPYVQLPLKGIGIGKLNVIGVGIQGAYLLHFNK